MNDRIGEITRYTAQLQQVLDDGSDRVRGQTGYLGGLCPATGFQGNSPPEGYPAQWEVNADGADDRRLAGKERAACPDTENQF